MWRIRSVVLLVVAVPACGSSLVAEERPTDSAEVWSALPYMGLGLRVEREQIVAALAEEYEHRDAEYVDCMRDRGFDRAHTSTDVEGAVEGSLFRPTSVSDAVEHGFGMTSSRKADRETQDERLAEMVDEMAAGESTGSQAVVEDHEAGSAAVVECRTEVGVAAGQRGAEVVDTYVKEVMGATEVQHALSTWRECMADRGYSVDGAYELVGDLGSEFYAHAEAYLSTMSAAERDAFDDEFFAKESAAAVAVAECDVSAIGPAIDEWASLEERWMDRHADIIATAPVHAKYLLSTTLSL